MEERNVMFEAAHRQEKAKLNLLIALANEMQTMLEERLVKLDGLDTARDELTERQGAIDIAMQELAESMQGVEDVLKR